MIRVCAGVPAAANRMSVFCGNSLSINSIRVNVLCVHIHSIAINNCVFNDGILDDSVIVSRIFNNLGIDLLNGSVPERIFTAVRLLRQRCHRQHTQTQQHRQSCAQPSPSYHLLFTHTIFLLLVSVFLLRHGQKLVVAQLYVAEADKNAVRHRAVPHLRVGK